MKYLVLREGVYPVGEDQPKALVAKAKKNGGMVDVAEEGAAVVVAQRDGLAVAYRLVANGDQSDDALVDKERKRLEEDAT